MGTSSLTTNMPWYHSCKLGKAIRPKQTGLGSTGASYTSDCLGCAVLLCLIVCLTLLASFFSFFIKNNFGGTQTRNHNVVSTCTCM